MKRPDGMNRVLILSPFYPPFPRPGATKRTENFVRYLPENGWKPVILTMDWGYGDRTAAQKAGIFYTRNIAYASWKAYQVADVNTEETLWTRALKRSIAVLRAIKTYLLVPDELVLWLCWALPAMRRILRAGRLDALYATAPPNSSLLIGVVLKKLYKLPLICDIRDDWCGNPLMEKKSALLRAVERCMERWVVGNADRIVVVTEASLDLWSNRYPDARGKFGLIPNGYSEDEYAASPAHEFRDIALVHVGSLELNRSPEPLYRALSQMDLRSLQIGFYQYGLTLREYRDMARRYGIENLVHFEGTIPQQETISRIKGASLLVLLPTQNAPTAIPGKAYEYLRTGKPILLISRKNAATEFMKSFPRVYHVVPDDTEACIAVIRKIAGRVREPEGAGGAGIKRFDRRNLTGSLAETLDFLLKETGRRSSPIGTGTSGTEKP